MLICSTCKQPIEVTVVESRKLVAQIKTGPYAGSGRFLTILRRTCGCGASIERRYENQILAPVGH